MLYGLIDEVLDPFGAEPTAEFISLYKSWLESWEIQDITVRAAKYVGVKRVFHCFETIRTAITNAKKVAKKPKELDNC